GALEQASNRLARALQAASCTRGDRVGLLLPKSPRALVGMFGALKADCIYVPIDVASPLQRIERILDQCECRCLLAEQSTAGMLYELTASRAGVSAGGELVKHTGGRLFRQQAAAFALIEGPFDALSPTDAVHRHVN